MRWLASALLVLLGCGAHGDQLDKIWSDEAMPRGPVDPADDRFGFSLSMSGTADGRPLLLIGANFDEANGLNSGAAYLFDCTNPYECVQTDKLMAQEAKTDREFFGEAVSIDGTLVAVGQPYDSYSGRWSGSVFIYDCSNPHNCKQQKKLMASGDAYPQDDRCVVWRCESEGVGVGRFGMDVRIHRGVVVVGAPTDDLNGLNSGSVYVFDCRDPANCAQKSKFWVPAFADSNPRDDRFGMVLCILDNLVAVGAPRDEEGGGYWAGSVCLYDISDLSNPQFKSKLVAVGDTTPEQDEFGHALAMQGTLLVVGAWRDEDRYELGYRKGSVSLFDVSNPSSPILLDKLFGDYGFQVPDALEFGCDVAVSGNLLVVGAHRDQEKGFNAGAVFVFECDDWSSCVFIEKLMAIDPDNDPNVDGFGFRVKTDGALMAVSAPADESNGYPYENAGSVYLFNLTSLDCLYPPTILGAVDTSPCAPRLNWESCDEWSCGAGRAAMGEAICVLGGWNVSGASCPPPTCADGVMDGDETGVDCGGSCLVLCPSTCEDNTLNGDEAEVDCGGSCDVCPTCSDGTQNGDELYIDCGGTCVVCPTPTPPYVPETTPSPYPTFCDDGTKNGDELGVDCGGSCGVVCPTCRDKTSNGDETGVDCGGSCASCSDMCIDMEQNGDEEGVDCGGSCPPCPIITLCDDATQNGDEEGVDCGGSCSETICAPTNCTTATSWMCSGVAGCTWFNGTATCECPDGYEGDGRRDELGCTPICEPGLCGGNSDCVSPGVCLCEDGYSGDGTDCMAICEEESECHADGWCLRPGVCECNEGFEGDGLLSGSGCALPAGGILDLPDAVCLLLACLATLIGCCAWRAAIRKSRQQIREPMLGDEMAHVPPNPFPHGLAPLAWAYVPAGMGAVMPMPMDPGAGAAGARLPALPEGGEPTAGATAMRGGDVELGDRRTVPRGDPARSPLVYRVRDDDAQGKLCALEGIVTDLRTGRSRGVT